MRVRVPGRGMEYFRVHASVLKLAGIAAYLAFVTGVSSLCVSLSRHVGTQAVVLAAPHVVASGGERLPTLVERRQIEAGDEVEPSHPEIARAPSVLEMPGISAPVLAAKLDVLERQDLLTTEPRTRRLRTHRARVARGARPVRMAAADDFGRSFGVMLRASR